MWQKTKNYATGIWSSGVARTKAELGLIKNELTDKASAEYAEVGDAVDFTIRGKLPGYKDFKGLSPSYQNAAARSLTSKGALKAGAIGAGVGAGYGLYDDETSIMKGAAIGAGVGYLGKGLIGMAGERRTLHGLSKEKLTNSANVRESPELDLTTRLEALDDFDNI